MQLTDSRKSNLENEKKSGKKSPAERDPDSEKKQHGKGRSKEEERRTVRTKTMGGGKKGRVDDKESRQNP